MAEEQGHRGIIRIDLSILKDLLLLPDEYVVETMQIDTTSNILLIFVRHPDLPGTVPYQPLPDVKPIYTALYGGSGREGNRLKEIQVTTYPVVEEEEL